MVSWTSCATFRSRKVGVFALLEAGWEALAGKSPGRDFSMRARGEKRDAQLAQLTTNSGMCYRSETNRPTLVPFDPRPVRGPPAGPAPRAFAAKPRGREFGRPDVKSWRSTTAPQWQPRVVRSTQARRMRPSHTSIFATHCGNPPRGLVGEPGQSSKSAGRASFPTTISGTWVCP